MSSLIEWVERLQPSSLHVETDEQGRPRIIKLELPVTRCSTSTALEAEAARGERTVAEMADVLEALEQQRARDLDQIEALAADLEAERSATRRLTAELAVMRARVAAFARDVVEGQ